MIASVHGKVLQLENNSIIVEVNGVGFNVFVPAPVKDSLSPGDLVFLWTHLIVRQDALILYGFDTREARDVFNLLLTVDGVGPKAAISILSTLTPDTIRRALFNEQPEIFSRVPGIGKKTAQKIMLTLQDKIKVVEGLEPMARISDIDTEVLSALTALGYSVVEAQAAVQTIPRSAPEDVEERLRLALQYFGG